MCKPERSLGIHCGFISSLALIGSHCSCTFHWSIVKSGCAAASQHRTQNKKVLWLRRGEALTSRDCQQKPKHCRVAFYHKMARAAKTESGQTLVASLPRRKEAMCCASAPRLSTPLDPASPHRSAFHIFPLKEKYNCLTAQRISKPHAGNTVRQLGNDVTWEQCSFSAVILRLKLLKSRFENPESFAKSEREAPSRSLPSPPSATCWNCPPGILSRQGNSQNKRLFLPFLFGCLQAGCHSYSLVHGF